MPMTTVGLARVFAMRWDLIPVEDTGERVQAAAKESGIDIEVVKGSDEAKGFVVQPKRWRGERTLGRFRLG